MTSGKTSPGGAYISARKNLTTRTTTTNFSGSAGRNGARRTTTQQKFTGTAGKNQARRG